MPANEHDEATARRERQRLDRVFGEVLPETTRDERGRGEVGERDEELRRNVPPHHG